MAVVSNQQKCQHMTKLNHREQFYIYSIFIIDHPETAKSFLGLTGR